MKHSKLVLAAVLFVNTAALTLAAPASKRTSTSNALHASEDFAGLNAGDKIALVCKQCETVSVQTVASKGEAIEFCKEGAEIICPSCHKTFKVVRHGPPGKGGTHVETRIVNDKGEVCMFVVKLPN
ncbi:MAG: hypothetical protein A3G75_01185 [Verrucomicrobia bacterium RIFCSPLOWO2_12_FULL_64_8]|nr:MAG: hypothetical protein A3G75_01185 [Verrucomicrobia bacterium RIFCSPLOWO2_12_FULL_64_8]